VTGKSLIRAVLLLACLGGAAGAQTTPKEFSAADRSNLRRAARIADRFVERFRRTLDFGTAWEEFRRSNPRCTYETGLFSPGAYEFKSGVSLVKRLYVSSMNVYLLKAAHDLSILRIDDEESTGSEETYTPNEILAAERKNKWFRPGDDDDWEPRSARELGELIREMDALARLYRKHMPRDAMRSAAWRDNYQYLTHRGGYEHTGVGDGDPTLCVPEHTKVYIVDRGIFYFYIVEERGHMRVAGLGID
jgi:hypothetical protein